MIIHSHWLTIGTADLAFAVLGLTLANVSAAKPPYLTTAIAATTTAVNHPQGSVVVPAPMKLVGGGAQTNWTGNGNLLTASRPAASGQNTWMAAAKDHLVADPATLSVFGIGLTDAEDDWEVIVRDSTSAVEAHPVASVEVPKGYVMTGGGCAVNWKTSPAAAGNLLTASFPSSLTTWECRAKDHAVSSPATLTAYVIGIRPKNPALDMPVIKITTAVSPVAAHPVAMANGIADFAITGGGALALPSDPNGSGQLLTMSAPQSDPKTGKLAGWQAASKDHSYASPGTVQAFAINLRFPTLIAIPETGSMSNPPAQPAALPPVGAGRILLDKQVVTPGPAPQVSARAIATYVQLSWVAVPGTREYIVRRSEPNSGSNRISSPGYLRADFLDAVPDPRYDYQYTVSAVQTDGRVGNTSVLVRAPFATPNPTDLSAARMANGDVVLSWPLTQGAVSYRLDGGNFPNTGFAVAGQTYTPSVGWTADPVTLPSPDRTRRLRTVVQGLGPNAYDFRIVAIYPGNFADYAHPATTRLSSLFAHYRITLNGFLCNSQTADGIGLDGRGDEVYASVIVHQINRANGQQGDFYEIHTPVYGDVYLHSRLQAGSASNAGGIATDDYVPKVAAIPGTRIGYLAPRVEFLPATKSFLPPAIKSSLQQLPVLVWDGELRTGGDVLILKPSVWEEDGQTPATYGVYVNEQSNSSIAAIWSQPSFQAMLAGNGGNSVVIQGKPKSPLGPFFSLEYAPPLIAQLITIGKDRPVGLTVNGNNIVLQQPIMALTRETIEAALAKPLPGLQPGVIPVTLEDGPSTIQIPLAGKYTLYFQVERLP